MTQPIDFRVFADAVLVADVDGVVRDVRSTPDTPLHLGLVAAVGQPYDTVLPAAAARGVNSCFAAIAAGSPVAQARFDLPTDHGARRFEARVARDRDKADYIIIALRDVTGLEAAPAERVRDADDAVYRSIFEGAAIGISVVMRGGAIIETNTALQELLGYSAQEIRGRHYLDFCHPDDIELDERFRREVNAGTRDAFKVTKRYLSKSGNTIWADLTVSVLRDADGAVQLGIGMIEDKTQRVRAEEALRGSEERFRIAASSASDLVYEWNLDDDTIHYFGSDGDAAAGTLAPDREAWAARVHPDDRVRISVVVSAHIADGEPFDMAYRYLLGDDDWRHWVDRGTPIMDAEGRPRRIVGARTDVTQQLRLEQKLVESQRMEAIGQLAGGVAHDFNNVLVGILANIDFALDAIETPAIRRDLIDARRAAERAATLTRNLLAFGRKQVLRPVALSVNKVIVEMMRMLRRTLGAHVRIRFQPGTDLSATLVDVAQLEQVLVNLCVNARDAMPDGGRLTVATTNERLDNGNAFGLDPGRYVRIDVSDTGCGIATGALERIFDPFFSTKGSGKGTGLGLPMAQVIVEQHGGALRVESAIGVGTTFSILLPSVEHAPTDLQASSTEPGPPPRGNETILVAEDDQLVRQMAVRILEGAGYRVLTADDGVEAVALFEARGDEIDLVLLDVIMPRMGGRTAHDEIKRRTPEMRFAFVSGYATEVLDAEFRLANEVRVMSKPYSGGDSRRFVRAALDGA